MDVREIPLCNGGVSIIDAEDSSIVEGFNWRANQSGRQRTPYAATRKAIEPGRTVTILMHRLILNAPPGVQVDHVNGNGLDNRKENLRLCSARQNAANRDKVERSESRFKGVGRSRDRWRAFAVNPDGRFVHIGVFDSEEEAARAYDAKAEQMYGPFARLNFPH